MHRLYRYVFSLLAAFYLLCPALQLSAETKVAPFIMPSARFSALGGRHCAAADDFYAIFLNPASFVSVENQFSAAEITLSAHGPVFEIIDLFRKNSGSVEDVDLTGIMGYGGLAAGFDLGGPLSLGWVGKGLGLGIFNRVVTTAAISRPYLRPVVAAEILFSGGYAFRIIGLDNHKLDAGFLGKGFFRGALDMKTPVFSIGSLDPFESPFGANLGFGFDLGVRYSFRGSLSAAVVCYDVYSPVLLTPYDVLSDFTDSGSSGTSSYATVKRRLDAGLSYRIRSAFLERYISRLTVMADYHDILDLFSLIPRNPILNAGLGIEVALLKVLSFRFGVADALPAFGFGLDLSFMKLDFAIFGREMGLDPGRHSVYAMSVGLLFRY